MSKSTDDLSSTCPLCYQDITIYAIGACDHTICHVCSAKMRALCNQLYCPVCRTDLPQVVFMTKHHQYSGIITHRFPRDRSAKIWFENNGVRLQYNQLLAHQCGLCDGRLAEGSFKLLQDHMRKEHELFYCDLCMDHLNIFTSERKCYNRKDLAQHRRKGDKDDTSYRGHPLCEFCDKRYFDKDELLKHLRRDHYYCHFCDSTGISNQYYHDYDNLKVHFRESHFLCEQGDCEVEQFSHAFASEIDLKAHKAAVHSGSFSKSQARQNRQIDVEINLPPRTQNRGRGGGHGVGRGRAHLLHANEDEMQRALEASIHTARAEDDKQEQSGEPSKRGKNRKVPELEYTDVRNDPYYYQRKRQEKQHVKPVAEKKEIPHPEEFPNLLHREAENRSPLMSSSWVKPQTQGPDYPELTPSSAAAPPRPQSYSGSRQQQGWKHDPVEGYPALSGRNGPGTNRRDAPATANHSKQSPKMPSKRDQMNPARPNTGAMEVRTSKASGASSFPQKQIGKSKKNQKIESLSEYPMLGAKGEPDRNHQGSFRDPPSGSKTESETSNKPSSRQQSYQGAAKPRPGRVDSLSDYPLLGGGAALPSGQPDRNHQGSFRDPPSGSKTESETLNKPSSRQQSYQGAAKPRPGRVDSLSDYPLLGEGAALPSGQPDRNHQGSFRDPPSGSKTESETSTKPSSRQQSYQGAAKPRPGRVDSLSDYPLLGGGASLPSGQPDRNHQGSFRDPPSGSKTESETSTKPSSRQQSYQGAAKPRPGRVDSLSDYPLLGGGASLPSSHHVASTHIGQTNGTSTQREQANWSRSRNDSSKATPSRTTQSTNDSSYSATTNVKAKPEDYPLLDFPSLSSIATLLSNDKKDASKKKEPSKQIESKRPLEQRESKRPSQQAEPKRPPQQAEPKRPVKAEVQPLLSKEETKWKEETAATQQAEVKPPMTKAPPGFISHPPPGFAPGPPPGFGSVPVRDVGYVPPPASDVGYVPPPARDVSYQQPEDYKDRNKELVRKIKKCLKDKTGGFDEFRTLSGQFRTGILSAYGYYDRCLSLLGSNFKSIFDELVSLLPDVDKQQELLRVQQERESSNQADAPSAVLKISKNSSAAPWKDGSQRKHKVCPQCQQMVLSKDYDSHLNSHQDFPSLGSAVPVRTNTGRNSAWGRMK